jgi:uncharacterized SAM-binding protein YcdF (DUF218 family)
MISLTASKLLALLIYPLSCSLLLCATALLLLFLKRVRGGAMLLGVAVGWLYLCSTGLFANYLMRSLEQDFPPQPLQAVHRADVIVVLGGATRGYAHQSVLPDLNQQADRLVYAAQLYKAGKAPILLLTGGVLEGSLSEARQMQDVLSVMGIPSRAMLLEADSHNTHDNAVFSATMLRAQGVHRILLVTSAFHMRRARALFEAQGLEVVPAPTDFQQVTAREPIPDWLPWVSNLAQTTNALHEIAGYWVYRWRGWL